MFCEYRYANLLLALETISWNLNYLPQVSLALAWLSEICSIEGYSNSPLNSLKEIFLGWVNNTSATHEERLQIIDSVLIRSYPEVAWKLLISLLPEDHGSFSRYICKPNYRDWADSIQKGVLDKKYYLYVECLAAKVITLVDNQPELRYPELVKNITRLPKKAFEELTGKLLLVNWDEMSAEVRLKISNELRSIISMHREFEDSKWALPKESIDKLEEIFSLVIPDDLLLKNNYLFNEYYPQIIDPILRKETNRQELDQIVESARIEVLLEIYQTMGIDGIKRLVTGCTLPDQVGHVIAKSELRNTLESELLDWLETDESSLITASQSFVFWCAIVDESWVNLVSNQCSYRSKDWITNFLLGSPFRQYTFKILNQVDTEIATAYWRKVTHYYLIDNDLGLINWVVEQLLINGRPLNALDATCVFYGSRHDFSLDCNLLVNALKQIAFMGSSNSEHLTTKIKQISDIQTRDRSILKAIEYIQEQGQLLKEEVANIEWIYLQLLKYNSLESIKPLYLEKEILDNPEFFVHILSLVFNPNDEGELSATSKKTRADKVWLLLSMISGIPGQQENSVNSEKLREWVYKAREQLEKLKILRIGDGQIGTILSNSPLGNDGIWPHEAVRDLIEDLKSPVLEDAFETGKWNLRGGTTRFLFDGGKQERDLAKKYHYYAKKLTLQWPRTSEILRRLERSYERHGDREDWNAELFE